MILFEIRGCDPRQKIGHRWRRHRIPPQSNVAMAGGRLPLGSGLGKNRCQYVDCNTIFNSVANRTGDKINIAQVRHALVQTAERDM